MIIIIIMLHPFCQAEKQALLAFALGMYTDQNLQREKHAPETLCCTELLQDVLSQNIE